MAIVKSKLLKQLADGYPNFLKKDLDKFLNIFLTEIKESLKRGLPERKGVVRHTKSGDEIAIKIKYSIGIILYLLLKYWQHLYCYLQSKKHLNQNKHLKKL